MKAHQIEVGEVYVARVSGKLANIKVEQILMDGNGKRRWQCRNLVTGKKVLVRGAARFRFPARMTLTEEEAPVIPQPPPEVIKLPETILSQERIQVLYNQLVYEKGESIITWPNYPELLAEVGLSVEQITEEVRSRASEYVRQHLEYMLVRNQPDLVSGDSDSILETPATKSRGGVMQVQETDARKVLIALGLKKAATSPIKILEARLNAKGFGKIAVKKGKPLEDGSEELATFRSICDALEEGEVIKIKAEEEEESEPAAAGSLKKKKPSEDVAKTQESVLTNGDVTYAPPRHPQVKYHEVDKAKLVKISETLAKKFRDLERYPNDREIRPVRCTFLREQIRLGYFRGSEWVSARCAADGKVYRLNGKHTSAVICELYESGEKFADFHQLVREYECNTMEDMAHLFASFDPKESARSKNDIVKGFAATKEPTRELPSRMLNLITTGLAFNVWQRNYRRQSPVEQSLLLLQHTDFATWVTTMLHNKKGAEHLRRMSVIAAMARTWFKDPDAAEEFWTKLRDDCDDPKAAPTRKLYRYLLTHKVGAVKDASESVSDLELFIRCLLAWNAWRGQAEAAFKPDMEPPLAF